MDLLGLKNNIFKQDEFLYFLNKNSLNDIISLKIIGEPIFHIYKKKIVRLMFDLSDKNEVSVQDVRKFGDEFSSRMRRGPFSTEVLKIFFKERLPKTLLR